jgi:hypothetical protein
LGERFGPRTFVVGGIGLALGLLIGWLLVGWTLWPVTWSDADPWDLRPQYRDAYIASVADSLAGNGNTDLARERLAYWDPTDLAAAIQRLSTSARTQGAGLQAQNLDDLRRVLGQPAGVALSTPVGTRIAQASPAAAGTVSAQATVVRVSQPTLPVTATIAKPKASPAVRWLLILGVLALCVIVVLAAVGWAARRGGRAPTASYAPMQAMSPEGFIPIGRLEAAYRVGETGYSETFDINGPTGDLVGDLGLAVAQTVDGDDLRVTAFETWLYDKAAVQTTTKVLMSDYAFGDAAIRTKLAPRGEAIQVREGTVVVLETRNLRAMVTVREAAYGAEPPARGCFERLAVQVQTFAREAPAEQDGSATA